MATGSIKLRLRPLRLAFLVRPSDAKAIATAIETTSFLWGGSFNPIIPFFHKLPSNWDRFKRRDQTARAVLEGYLDTFDPDVIVKVGELESEQTAFGHRPAIKCSEILANVQKRGTPEYGIGMFEVLQYFYETELKFVRQHPIMIRLPEFGTRHKLFLASVFGAFSPSLMAQFTETWLKRIPCIKIKKCGLSNYADFLKEGNLFIRRFGMVGIQGVSRRSFRPNDCLFFLDANSNLDILDYWNLRAVGWTVMPICKQAAGNPDLQREAAKFVEENSWAYRDNPNCFNTTTLLKSRSTTIDEMEKFGRILQLAPKRSEHEEKIVYSTSYPRMWDEWARRVEGIDLPEIQIKQADFRISNGESLVSFTSLAPDFADDLGPRYSPRCANEINAKIWTEEFLPAEVVPEGDGRIAQAAGATFGENWRCARSGLVYFPHYKDEPETLRLKSGGALFEEWLHSKGWNANVSDKGHVAIQMLKQLGGTSWIEMLANREIILLLKKLGGGKTLHADAFRDEVARIASKSKFGTTLALMQRLVGAHIGAKMVQVGFEIKCPSCRQHSWYSIKEADYQICCPICFEKFPLPTDDIKQINWAYRAVGPFALPSQAYGIYSVLLTLRFFKKQLHGATTPILSFIANKGAISLEVDLGLFFRESKWDQSPTELVLAECKTFNHFEKKDAQRMQVVAREFPGAVLVFATLNTNLTDSEKKLLRPIVNEGRRYWRAERPYNPVLVLTGNELFADDNPRKIWAGLGSPFTEHGRGYPGEDGLMSLADATQQIYLGMNPWHDSVVVRRRALKGKEKTIAIGLQNIAQDRRT